MLTTPPACGDGNARTLADPEAAAPVSETRPTARRRRIPPNSGSPEVLALVRGEVAVTARTYDDDAVTPGFEAAALPLVFLLVFFLSVLMLGNQMLTSTLEEKENRVTEMILTTMNPTTLIVGKIVSVFLLGLVQLGVLLVPGVVAYAFFRTNLDLPELDLSGLVVDPATLGIAFLLFAGGSCSSPGRSSRSAPRCPRSRRPATGSRRWRSSSSCRCASSG